MPGSTPGPLGDFCWVELQTPDPRAAKAFYGALFGWTFQEDPLRPDAVCTTLRVAGKELGGLSEYDASRKERAVSPRWLTFVAVASADDSAARARALSATVLLAPADEGDAGRMAILEDPQGAAIGVWQAGRRPGAAIRDETGSWGWLELSTTDDEAAREFYRKLFGWGAKVSTGGGMAYTEFQHGGTSIGGCMKLDPSWGPAPPHWLVYFLVDVCVASAASATALGASLRVPPADIPDVGRFAVLADPAGAVFAILQVTELA